MNNELMEQCRKEAGRLYEMPVFDEHRFVQTTDTALAAAVVEARREAYAAALYAERSKRRELTDEEIERLGAEHEASLIEFGQDPHISNIERIAFETGLVQSRYYLAPATGLTVERAMEVMARYFFEVRQTNIGHRGSKVYDDLLARLTEAAKH